MSRLISLVPFAFLVWATLVHSLPSLQKPEFYDTYNVSASDFFWYVTENGEAVPAFLKGGPKVATLANVETDVQFWLYKNGKQPGIQIRPGCSDCLSSYTSGAPLIILSHGFTSNHESFGSTFLPALASRNEPMNVVVINWKNLAAAPWYETAANNVVPVGTYTAELVNFLMQQRHVTLDKIHFAGHSLGSHVGNHLAKNIAGGKIARITALDPALPLFGQKEDSERIDPSDAAFVDVIHTAMGVLPSGLSFTEPRGHVDYYPNSGKNQPGCGIDAVGTCSHGRANSYFAESIGNPRAFVACKCTNWEEYANGRCVCTEQQYMGWSTLSSARGLYYLRTNANPPYGQG